MALLTRLRSLDERVLGRSDTTRGRLVNLFVLRAHPLFWPIYAIACVTCLVAAAASLLWWDVWAAVCFTLAAAGQGFYAFASRRIPR